MQSLNIQSLLPRSCFEQIYVSLIRSILDYADIIYDNCTISESKTLESVQRRAALLSTGAIRLTKHDRLLGELGLETLKTRRRWHRLIYLFKIKNELVPQYMREIYPLRSHNVNNYNLRRDNQLIQPQARTNYFSNSFFPSTIRDWNSLPQNTTSVLSVNLFKKSLKSAEGLEINKNPLFSVGHRTGKTIHTRLRLGLSGLNDHLFKYNLSRSRFCEHCHSNSIENSEHYFLFCDRFSHIRDYLLTTVKNIICPNINVNLLLNLCPAHIQTILLEGSIDLSFQENTAIISSLQFHRTITEGKMVILQM